MKTREAIQFVIFDLDGTLVDSELLCNQAFLDLLPNLARITSVANLVAMNRGRKLSEIIKELQKTFSISLPANFESMYRSRVQELFATELAPVTGVPEMLQAIPLPKCVASSGPRSKIEQALEVSGLLPHFKDCIYSSYEVGSWKPDPGLFTHAINRHGFDPRASAVIEDSGVGIQAAAAAGAQAFYYSPSGLPSSSSGHVAFQSMLALPGLLGCA